MKKIGKAGILLFVALTILLIAPAVRFTSAQKPLNILCFGSGSYIQAIRVFLEDLGRGYNFTMIDSPEILESIWAERDKYDLIIIEYHALRDNPFLAEWANTSGEEIRRWVESGGGIIATIKDDEDEPLASLFSLTKADAPDNLPSGARDELILIDPLSPFGEKFGKNIPDYQIEIDTDNGFEEPLPEWVKYVCIVTNGTATCPVFVAGEYGEGALFFGGPEFTSISEPNWAPGNPKYDNFWKNIMLWMEEVLGAEAPPPEEAPPSTEENYYTKEEVDALIQDAISQVISQAVSQAEEEAQNIAKQVASDAVQEVLQQVAPDTTTPTALGAVGIILAIIAIAISLKK
ncbi:MAG TPA: hypothetical protein ENH03_03895 [Candidatus Bathyarchaeota archaeon]|nr:hypothetical protein [Candidatus Bathyarchaeota archaeon]